MRTVGQEYEVVQLHLCWLESIKYNGYALMQCVRSLRVRTNAVWHSAH
jgi:hypothetical protein